MYLVTPKTKRNLTQDWASAISSALSANFHFYLGRHPSCGACNYNFRCTLATRAAFLLHDLERAKELVEVGEFCAPVAHLLIHHG